MKHTKVDFHQLEEVIARVNMIYDYIKKIEKKVVTLNSLSIDAPETVHEANAQGWLYAKQVCDALDVSERTLQRLQKDRVIEFTRYGKTPRFHPFAVYWLLKNNIVKRNPRLAENFKANYIVKDE